MEDIIKAILFAILGALGLQEPLLLTGYDPAEGGINCQEPCGQTALGYWIQPDDYWDGASALAACPPEWLGATVVIENFGTLRCVDTGGAIRRFVYNEYWGQYVSHIDILAVNPKEQPWNYNLITGDNWRLVWP